MYLKKKKFKLSAKTCCALILSNYLLQEVASLQYILLGNKIEAAKVEKLFPEQKIELIKLGTRCGAAVVHATFSDVCLTVVYNLQNVFTTTWNGIWRRKFKF